MQRRNYGRNGVIKINANKSYLQSNLCPPAEYTRGKRNSILKSMHRWGDYMNASYSFYGSPFRFHIHSNSQHWGTLLSTLVAIVFRASNSPRNYLCKFIFPTFPQCAIFCTCNKNIACSFRSRKASRAGIESFLSR